MSEPEPIKSPEWLREIVGAFEAVESLRGEPAWLSGDLPAWTQKLGAEFLKSITPLAHLQANTAWTPEEVGGVIGHQFAYWHLIFDLLSEDEEPSPNEAAYDALLAYFRRTLGEDFEKQIEEFWRVLAEEMAPAYKRALSMALTKATEQSYSDMTRFFTAFSRALTKKPTKGNPIGRTTTTVYLVMLVYWKQVEELGSIPALHAWLFRNILLKPQIVGDLKRVEKMCQRLGLSYPEIAERKSRASGSDMSA